MRKFAYPPEQAGYSVTPGAESISQKLKGGMSRIRTDILNASSIVNCTWLFDRNKYEYARIFYRDNIASGSVPFNIDLILDSSLVDTYSARFVPGTWKLASQQGHSYTITCDLEIEAKQFDPEFDDTLLWLVDIYGSFEAAAKVFSLLDKLVTYDLPRYPNGNV